MIKIDDYCIEQYIKDNKIVITLPQTFKTLSNTVTPVTDRKVSLSQTELATLLSIAVKMYEKNEVCNDSVITD